MGKEDRDALNCGQENDREVLQVHLRLRLSRAVSCGASGNNLEFTLRNKVDQRGKGPVFWKRVAKAQKYLLLYMWHPACRFDGTRESSLQTGEREFQDSMQCIGL